MSDGSAGTATMDLRPEHVIGGSGALALVSSFVVAFFKGWGGRKLAIVAADLAMERAKSSNEAVLGAIAALGLDLKTKDVIEEQRQRRIELMQRQVTDLAVGFGKVGEQLADMKRDLNGFGQRVGRVEAGAYVHSEAIQQIQNELDDNEVTPTGKPKP